MSDLFFNSFACVATSTGAGGLQSYFAFLPQWLFVGFAAIMLSFFVMLVVYAIGKLADVQNIESYLRMELWEAFFSFVILATTFAGVKFLCTLPPSIFLSTESLERLYGAGRVPADINIFDVITEYLLFVRALHSDALILFGFAQMITNFIDINWQSSAGGIGIQLTPLGGFSQQMQTVNHIITIFMNAYALHLVLFRVIAYSSHAFFNYLLPMGLFFRCLQPTRKFGGALIGLALGFNFVYPVLLLLNAKMLVEFSGYESLLYQYGKLSGLLFIYFVLFNIFSPILMLIGFVGATFYMLSHLFTNFGISNIFTSLSVAIMDHMLVGIESSDPLSLTNFFGWLLFPLKIISFMINIVGALVLLDVVFQTINFLIVVAAVKNFTKLFGEEMDISLLTRMV